MPSASRPRLLSPLTLDLTIKHVQSVSFRFVPFVSGDDRTDRLRVIGPGLTGPYVAADTRFPFAMFARRYRRAGCIPTP